MTPLSPLPARAVQRRSTRRRVVRAVSMGLVFLAAGYASLPLWLPTGWIARRITDQLTVGLNRPVEIGRVSIGWFKGVIIDGLTVSGRSGMPNELLARVRQVRFGFTPIATLVTEKVDQIEIVDPEVWLVFDERGRLINLDDLGQQRHRRLPSYHYLVRGAACHVLTPRVTQTFRIDRLACELERETGLLRLVGQVPVTREPRPGLAGRGSLNLEAGITVPRLKRDEKLDGDITVEWTELALTDLPLPLVTRLPIEQVDGATTGRLILQAHPDLGVDYDLRIAFDGVRILRVGLDRPAQVPDAVLHCRGHWDPNTDSILMGDLDCETRAIHLRRSGEATGTAMMIDPNSDAPFALHLAGQIKDWLALRREFPEVDVLARRIKATLTGRADFTIDFTQQGDEDRLLVTVQGGQSQWVVAGDPAPYLSAGVGVPKSLHLEMVRNRRTRRLSQPRVSLTVGDLALRIRSEVIVPPPEADALQWLTDALPTLNSRLRVKTSDIARVVALLPFLGEITDLTGWRGPLELETSIMPDRDASRVDLGVALAPETSLALGDWFRKGPGEALSLNASVVVPHRSTGQVGGFSFELACGQSRARLDGDQAELRYRFNFLDDNRLALAPGSVSAGGRFAATATHPPIALDASWVIPLRIDHLEGLLSLLPRWAAWAGPDSRRELAGSVELTSRSRISHRPDDSLMHNEVSIAADDLALRWDDRIDKPAGLALSARVWHRSHLAGGRREESICAAVRGPAGELAGSITFTGVGSGDPSNAFEHAAFRANVGDLAEWLAMTPALADRLACYHPSGGLEAELNSVLIEGERSVSVWLDATEAGFVVPSNSPFTKPAGVPAAARLRWRCDLSDSASREHRWRLVQGWARLPGANFTELTGGMVAGWDGEGPGPVMSAREVWSGQARIPCLESAAFHAKGDLTFDEPLALVHPEIRKGCDALDLFGTLTWDLHARIESGTLTLNGLVDAKDVDLSFDWDNPLVPAAHKSAGMPAVISCDLSVTERDGVGSYLVEVNDMTLDLDGNSVATRGTLAAEAATHQRPRLGEVDLTTEVQVSRPDSLLALLPDSAIDALAGRFEAGFDVKRPAGHLKLQPRRLQFDEFAVDTAAEPIHLDGVVRLDETEVDVGQLRWSWGRSGGAVSAVVYPPGEPESSRIGVAIESLDVKDLGQQLAALARPFHDAAETAPADGAGLVERLIDRLGQSNLIMDAHVGTLAVTLPDDVDMIADAVANRTTIANGKLAISFTGLVDGGYVVGSVESDLQAADPLIHLAYTAHQVQPGPVVDNYLRQSFPGMTATGPVTLIDESHVKLLPEPGYPNFDVGQGELVIEGGTVQGRAAPLWMTRVFPGLNLARFDFTYLHSWFDKRPDGQIHHQMIYQGRFYNIYMVGYGDADHRINYEVGIDFLADFDSQYWAASGQGRIPLFTKTGIAQKDGTLADERVVYVPKQFILGLLVKNNPVVTAYHAVRKRVLNQQ